MNTPDHQPIICGTDFSEPANQAANVAAALAKRLGAGLVLVHGIDERGEIPAPYWPALKDALRPQLAAEAERLRKFGASVQEELLDGVPADGVVKCAEQRGARMLVLASSGMGALGRWVMGSISERVAETAPVPTLIVRDSAPMEAWARGERALKIFIGADFTPVSDSALRWVAELREIGPCEITIGFIDRAPEERAKMAIFDAVNLVMETPEARERNERDLRAKAEHWLGVQPVTLRVTPGSSRIDEQLLRLARDAHADLIVIGAHQWHGLSRLRHASVSRRVLREARTNVACVPSRAPAAGVHSHLPAMRRVLAATDCSEHGGRAVPHACAVLGAGGAVCVLHVLKSGEQHEPILARMRELIPAEAAVRGIRSEVQVIESDDPAQGICDAADRFDADLICIGSHGGTGLLAAAMGSVAHAVIARSCRPVLVVRPPCS